MGKGFLKEIIYRIDYRLLPIKEYDDFYFFIVKTFGNYLVNAEQRYEKIQENEESTGIDNLVYIISSEDRNKQVYVGKGCLWLDIKLKQEPEEINYNNWFGKIVDYISSKADIFNVNRIGIRKNNAFYIAHNYVHKINDIFAESLIDNNLDDYAVFSIDNKKIYDRNNKDIFGVYTKMSTGNLTNDIFNYSKVLAHLVQFDFDYYTYDKESIISLMNDSCNYLNNIQIIIKNYFEKYIKLTPEEYTADINTMYEKYKAILID